AVSKMGRRKLTYYENLSPLKVVHSGFFREKEVVQKFLSIDPLTSKYPWYSPYQFAGNNPIWANDIDGLEENIKSTNPEQPQEPKLRQMDFKEVQQRSARIEVHMNNILNAVQIDEKLKNNPSVRNYLKAKISQLVDFDKSGNPDKVYGEQLFSGHSDKYKALLEKGIEKGESTALKSGVKKLAKLAFNLSTVEAKVLSNVFKPQSMGTGDTPMSDEIHRQNESSKNRQAQFTEYLDEKLKGGIDEVILGEKQSKPGTVKLEVKATAKDKVNVTK
ncbi:MAG: hypothetical protein ACYDEC_17435, partial [Bacteroidia bacterium]